MSNVCSALHEGFIYCRWIRRPIGSRAVITHNSLAGFCSLMYGESNECVDILFQQALTKTNASILASSVQGHDADRLQIKWSGSVWSLKVAGLSQVVCYWLATDWRWWLTDGAYHVRGLFQKVDLRWWKSNQGQFHFVILCFPVVPVLLCDWCFQHLDCF